MVKGIYIIIYYELVLVYSYCEYIGKEDKWNVLLYVCIVEYSYIYWIWKGVVMFFIDD